MQPARIFLNELDADRTLPRPEVGQWTTDANFLGNFKDDILVRGHVPDGVVNSVPSVFARPIQFYQALRTPTHPMHRAIRDQWRGLLAVFALRNALNLPVRVARFAIRDVADVATEDLDRRFVHILRSQAPHPHEEWSSWLLLHCNEELIGATSPWTIVYTPASYKLQRRIPWVNKDGMFADPATVLLDSTGANEELTILLAWIQLVIGKHPWGMASIHHDHATSTIQRQLAEWRKELTAVGIQARAANPELEKSSLAVPPFSHFLSAVNVTPIGSTTDSDLTILDDDHCGMIVLSRKALDNPQWRRKRVDGAIRVEELDLSPRALPGPSGDAHWRVPNGASVSRPYVIAEEFFLSDRLFKIPVTPDALNGGASEYVLPLKPQYFKHFGFAKLDGRNVSVQAGTEHVTVRLRLPLRSGVLEVERLYRTADEVEEIPEGYGIPAVAIWPDFFDADWKHYEAILTAAEPRPYRFLAAPLFSDGSTGPTIKPVQGHADVSVWPSARPVLGFALFTEDGAGNPVDAGLVVRRNTSAPKLTDTAWVVGIDFGTSNTQIMVKPSDGYDRPLSLHGRLLVLSAASPENIETLHDAIHHQGPVAPPFPTLLRKETIIVARGDGQEEQQIGIIPFKTNIVSLARDSSAFVRDLKWTADENTQRLYLEKLARMIAVEARAAGVPSLTMQWSYPISLPSRIKSVMESFWSATGSRYSTPAMTVSARLGMTESDAVSQCVAARNILPINAGSLSISVDIGGGSTDVAFWTENTLVDRMSLNVAANDVIRAVARIEALNNALVSMVVPDGVAVDAALWRERFKVRPEILWNALLLATTPKDSAPHQHPFVLRLAGDTSDVWRQARTVAFLTLGGISFYLGIHAAVHYAAAANDVALYVGGRGSSIFSWIAPPQRIMELIEQHFLAGLALGKQGARAAVQIRGPVVGTSGLALKDEVAAGLLESERLRAGTRSGLDLTTTVAGEVHWFDKATGNEVAWSDSVTAAKLATLEPPSNHNSSFIAHFLKHVVRPAVETFDLAAKTLGTLQLSQSWTINDMRKKSEESVLQPIFAYELKGLVRQYGEMATGSGK